MKLVPFTILLFGSIAHAQAPSREPDALQALLAEVHQLRQEIANMTVASQRVQIAMYAWQMQDAAVARAASRLDSIRSKCSELETEGRSVAADIQRLEGSQTDSNYDKKAAKEAIDQLKAHLEHRSVELQACQTSQSEATTQLREEQAKLSETQDQIGRFAKSLEPSGAGK